ncbi:peptidoglycan editing factor PgeF [Marinobacterium sp. D7]|uniref:peptidoglycan editing factor PgeF n=1 Tax=Marinobacterium ramblicola TaxID=2849041 RepID=UPI001C2DBC76|nr:peptidoglycan editing factor PgeF [Marinobacterium ramblicola]MBV1786706.1 peptidoglycan editing factor PgeF [Marinobacterium ramblicola]
MKLIRADWQAPDHIHALTTTRLDGVSRAPFNGLNLGLHVGDDPASVAENRAMLTHALGLKRTPQWLSQVHGVAVVEARDDAQVREADACWSDQPGQACVVMTADCLPVLFTDRQGTRVAAAHAGWRGLVSGVLEATLQPFDDPGQVLAWLGPAIGPLAFEVGGEVREQFVRVQESCEMAFVPSPTSHDKWLADLYQLARLRLQAAGVQAISGGDYCTFTEAEYFYSYRRDGQTGRMASLIWIEG